MERQNYSSDEQHRYVNFNALFATVIVALSCINCNACVASRELYNVLVT